MAATSLGIPLLGPDGSAAAGASSSGGELELDTDTNVHLSSKERVALMQRLAQAAGVGQRR
eukprot:COSAG01_NODE_2571_length_7440_cov_27.241384_2_plen_61_part_00